MKFIWFQQTLYSSFHLDISQCISINISRLRSTGAAEFSEAVERVEKKCPDNFSDHL